MLLHYLSFRKLGIIFPLFKALKLLEKSRNEHFHTEFFSSYWGEWEGFLFVCFNEKGQDDDLAQ